MCKSLEQMWSFIVYKYDQIWDRIFKFLAFRARDISNNHGISIETGNS